MCWGSPSAQAWGGGVITGGRLLEGARGLGGELGHMRIHAGTGEPCTCGAVGCWERHASTSALVRRAVQMDPALDSGRAIFAAAREEDARVQQLLEDWIVEIAEGPGGPGPPVQPPADPGGRRRQQPAGNC